MVDSPNRKIAILGILFFSTILGLSLHLTDVYEASKYPPLSSDKKLESQGRSGALAWHMSDIL